MLGWYPHSFIHGLSQAEYRQSGESPHDALDSVVWTERDLARIDSSGGQSLPRISSDRHHRVLFTLRVPFFVGCVSVPPTRTPLLTRPADWNLLTGNDANANTSHDMHFTPGAMPVRLSATRPQHVAVR